MTSDACHGVIVHLLYNVFTNLIFITIVTKNIVQFFSAAVAAAVGSGCQGYAYLTS